MKLKSCLVTFSQLAPMFALAMILAGPRVNAQRAAKGASPNGSKKSAVSGLLDVVLQGPFVVEKHPNGLVVYGPDVSVNHDAPLLSDQNLYGSRAVAAGDYELKISDPGSGSAQVANPVAATDYLTVNAGDLGLKSDPNGLHYFRIQLPLPQEIVPWNADPMKVAASAVALPGTKAVRYAVMLVLRYKYSANAIVQFSGKDKNNNQVSYDLIPEKVGQEGVLAITQRQHDDNDSTHPFAQTSFAKMLTLEPPLNYSIAFPIVTGPTGRNIPLIDDVVPRELTDFLSSAGKVSAKGQMAKASPSSRRARPGTVYMLISHSDCRAPILFVEYLQ